MMPTNDKAISSRRKLLKRGVGDRHACVAAPFAANETKTAKYFELTISKLKAPVVCGYAGKVKGKAIYADANIPGASPIWSEMPFLAMQQIRNKSYIQCCQYCFVPLGDYRPMWHEIVKKNQTKVQEQDLEYILTRLDLSRRNVGLSKVEHACVCGDVYCSKLCQLKAYHEFHSILCTKGDPQSPMVTFLRHAVHTNEIFVLAAKTIARILSRFLTSHDLTKAREPIDMFYKKPWWEVVMMEQHVELPHLHVDLPIPPQSLRELLTKTHELLLDALEYNLEYLEKEDQLNGENVDSIWETCDQVLSFEFFAALLGLFEMNNISMEIDHPFQVLMDILDPTVSGSTSTKEEEKEEQTEENEDPVVTRVRQVLETEEKKMMELTGTGFKGVDGTALFPLICTMNHSCQPNCTVLYTKNGEAHVVAVKDIQKGEELCICYIDIDQDVDAREVLLREYQFRCYCERCDMERRSARKQTNKQTNKQNLSEVTDY